MSKPKKLKPAKNVPVKIMPPVTARKVADKLHAQKDPNGVATFKDVADALKSIVTFNSDRAENVKLANQVLVRFGVRALPDLPVHMYDKAVAFARIVRAQMVEYARVNEYKAAREEAEAEQRGKRLIDFHFLLSAIGSLLACNPLLAGLASQVKQNDLKGTRIKTFDGILHERGALAIQALLAAANPMIESIVGDDTLPPAVARIMRRHMAAITAAVKDGYDFTRRYEAAREARVALEVWAAVISTAL